MIDVIVYKKNGSIHRFDISGHAESGPYGFDLVCAGVSAVSFGAVNALMEVSGIEPRIQQHSDGGYLSVEILPKDVTNHTVQTIVKTMIVSLQTIEQDYQPFIQIQWK